MIALVFKKYLESVLISLRGDGLQQETLEL